MINCCVCVCVCVCVHVPVCVITGIVSKQSLMFCHSKEFHTHTGNNITDRELYMQHTMWRAAILAIPKTSKETNPLMWYNLHGYYMGCMPDLNLAQSTSIWRQVHKYYGYRMQSA